MVKNSDSKLGQRIHEIIARAANEVAGAVRSDLADEVTRIVTGIAATRPQTSPKSPTTAKPVTVTKSAGPSQPPRGRARSGRKQGPDTGVIERIFKLIQTTPGLRNEQIRKQLALESADVKAALAQLRERARVKTRGTRRATVYLPL